MQKSGFLHRHSCEDDYNVEIFIDINRLSQTELRCLAVLPLVIIALHEVIMHAHFLFLKLTSLAVQPFYEIATAACDGSHRGGAGVYHSTFENILSCLNKELNSMWALSVYSFR